MLQQSIGSLPPEEPFIGAGVYAIYYKGNFQLYKEISKRNQKGHYDWPIYIGKAVPAGARKGGYGLGADPGLVLFKRLCEHGHSIDQAENLNNADFRCRFLVIDDIWIPLVESLLIEMFSPLWNRQIDGFGNHDPGKGRYKQQCSAWDSIHPGRPWAEKLQPSSLGLDKIRDGASVYIAKNKIRIEAPNEHVSNEE